MLTKNSPIKTKKTFELFLDLFYLLLTRYQPRRSAAWNSCPAPTRNWAFPLADTGCSRGTRAGSSSCRSTWSSRCRWRSPSSRNCRWIRRWQGGRWSAWAGWKSASGAARSSRWAKWFARLLTWRVSENSQSPSTKTTKQIIEHFITKHLYSNVSEAGFPKVVDIAMLGRFKYKRALIRKKQI